MDLDAPLTFKKSLADRLVAPMVFVLAFFVYLLTTSSSAYVGSPADVTAIYGGLKPRYNPAYPLWTIMTSGVSAIPIGSLALRFNVLCVFLGALFLSIGYDVVSEAIFRTVDYDPRSEKRAAVAARLGGLGFVVALGFSMPFWAASTRPGLQLFGLVWLAIVSRVYLTYCRSGRLLHLALFGLLYGVGLAESYLFIVFGPLFLLHLAIDMLRYERVRARPWVVLGVAGFVGALMYLVAAGMFYKSDGYEFQSLTSFARVCRMLIQNQFNQVRGLAGGTWLVYLFMAVVPWLAALGVAHRSLNGERDWSFYVLHGVLTVLSVGVFSALPWMFGSVALQWRGLAFYRPFISYLLLAMVFGYVLAYWALFPCTRVSPDAGDVEIKRAGAVGLTVSLLLLLSAGVVSMVNLQEVKARSVAFVADYADSVLDSLDGRDYLISDGVMDDHILIRAHDRGERVMLLDLSRARDPAYGNELESHFTSPQDRNMLDLGLLPMIQSWFERDPDVEQKVAAFRVPDILIGSGLHVRPKGLVFFGVRELDAIKRDVDVSRNMALWREWGKRLAPRDDDSRLLAGFRQYLRRHTSMVANNFGVMLQDLGRDEEAFDVYKRARETVSENVSALLNLVAMLDGGFQSDQADDIRNDLETLVKDESQRLHWSLSHVYGYVRSPVGFARQGMTWVLSGRPGIANVMLQKAEQMSDGKGRTAVKRGRAHMLTMQREDTQAAALYWEILVENPDDYSAMIPLARIAIQRGDMEQAKELLERAEKAGAPKPRMALEWASFMMVSGEMDQARLALEDLVSLDRENKRAWALLSSVSIEQEDYTRAEQAIRKLELLMADPHHYLILVRRAQLARKKLDWADVQRLMDVALENAPSAVIIPLMEMALRADIMVADKEQARKRADKLLRLMPKNWLANYVKGSLFMGRRLREQAELHFRASLADKRNALAANDLAMLLLDKREKLPEAMALAREATELNPKLADLWDTLGLVLFEKGDLDGAERNFDKALKLNKNDPRAHLHLAQVLFAKGKYADARAAVEMVEERRALLPESDKKMLEELAQKLTGRR